METGISLMELDCHSHGPGDIFENRGPQRVDLRRRNDANSQTGIYSCYIDVHSDTDNSVRDTVYVGLYTASGGMFYKTNVFSPLRKACPTVNLLKSRRSGSLCGSY